MLIDTTEKKEIAELILGLRSDEKRKSTLQLALESAKFHVGIDNGSKLDQATFFFRHHLVERIQEETSLDRCSDEAELFSALLLYLNVLEQIGALFCNDKDYGSIVNAFNAFVPDKLNKEEICAVKNLRNSLAHNFGLVNYNQRTKKPTVKFSICFTDDKETIVELPRRKWNGSFDDKSDETQCKIYAFPLIKWIEQILIEVKERFKSGTLSFAIEDLEEIKARFTIII